MTTTPNRDGFARLLLAEWTKLRTVRRWVIALFAAGALTVGLSMLANTGSGTDVNQHPDFVIGPDGQPVEDDFYFVHQPVAGDATITVRVASQDHSGEWDRAGVMIKAGTQSGAAYTAAYLTPGHSVRMEANFGDDIAARTSGEPRWLRLTRSGTSVMGYTSTDGSNWSQIDRLRVDGLPATAEFGFFVSSPPQLKIVRAAGSTSVRISVSDPGRASFDHVSVSGASTSATAWHGDAVHRPLELPDGQIPKNFEHGGDMTEADGVFTVLGNGKIGPSAPDDDPIQIALFGVIAGLIALASVAVLSVTSEYRRGMIGATLAASPRRGRILAAKAIVIGTAAYVICLVASVISVLATRSALIDNGYGPPAFPPVSLFDPPVLRALLLTAAFVAAMAVFSIGVGTIMRHSAGAITTVLGLILVPIIVSFVLPATPALWLVRLTPLGGFATQRAKPPTPALAEAWSMISPWTGILTVACYAAASMLGAWWLLRRRDA